MRIGVFYFSGSCDDSIPLQFIEKPPVHIYVVAGQDVTMHFEYNGVNIHNVWKVNHTHTLNNAHIRHSSHHSKLHCDELYDLTLINVQYGGYFTIYPSRGAYNSSGLHRTIHLSM